MPQRVCTWTRIPLLALAALTLAVGCDGGDKLSPSSESPATPPAPIDSSAAVPVDSSVAGTVPGDSLTTVPPDSAAVAGASAVAIGTQPGIVFGSWFMTIANLSSVHNGTLVGGQISPTNILTWLSGARAKGARVVIKLCMGKDSYVKNSDGTFSFTKWKALVDKYRTVN